MISADLYPDLPDAPPVVQLRALCDRWSAFRVRIRRESNAVCCQAGFHGQCFPCWVSSIQGADVAAAKDRAARLAVGYWASATIAAG
ncbi:MAG: hypothetical protein IOC66_33840 [Burkholderia sp.]|nr:hypothetical protein [Burkholderia sp.]